jgi:hypothetical protein
MYNQVAVEYKKFHQKINKFSGHTKCVKREQ